MSAEDESIPTPDTPDPLERIQVRRYLAEVQHFLLRDEGEIKEAPGKLSLVWTDPLFDVRRYLSVKASGSDHILVNGKRYPATEDGLKRALVLCLKELH